MLDKQVIIQNEKVIAILIQNLIVWKLVERGTICIRRTHADETKRKACVGQRHPKNAYRLPHSHNEISTKNIFDLDHDHSFFAL